MIALLLSIKLKHNIFRRMCYYDPQLSVDIVTVICLLLEVKFLHIFCLTIISEYNSYNLSNAFKLLFLFDLCNFNISFKPVAMNLP